MFFINGNSKVWNILTYARTSGIQVTVSSINSLAQNQMERTNQQMDLQAMHCKSSKKMQIFCVEHEATSESSRFQYHLYQEAVGDVTVGHPSVILLRNNKFQSSLHFPHLSSLPVTRKTVVSRLQRAKQATMKESHHKHPLSQASTKKPCDTKFIQIEITPALRGLRGLPTTQIIIQGRGDKLSITTHPMIFEWYSLHRAWLTLSWSHQKTPRTPRWTVDFEASKKRYIEPACFELF